MTRAIIETAVDRGIRDITEDPKRSLRRLADMGKQFSTGNFQKLTFSHITNLLRNNDSPYYKMLESFLANVDHETIKTFGLNTGYDSWTYGARVMRLASEKTGFLFPWCILIHYDPTLSKGISVSDIDRLIDILNPFGVNTFAIIKEKGIPSDKELIALLKKHKDCSFFFFINDALISIDDAEDIKHIGNTVISLNIASKNAETTCRLLKEIHALYVIHYDYLPSEIDDFSDTNCIDKWLSYESAFIFLFQKGSCNGLCGKFATDTRMNQDYPILIWDVYSDIRRVENLVYDSESKFIFEIDSDGSIRYPENTGLNILNTDILTILEKIAPSL